MTTTYQALARKWRPQTFDDVVAQPQVTTTLRNALSSGRIHHAYLFCGPRGTGKTTTARILAKALNCAKGPTADPCNECHACLSITNGTSLDVLEIDAASNTGIDNMRALRESALVVPAESRFKIFIIDEVHRLSSSAKDALLKTLEEPPAAVKFIFATTEAHEVPQTVRSRSLRLDFHLLTQDALRQHLLNIARNEGIQVEPGAVDLIATEAAGSVRDSLSLLDQVAAYAGGTITVDITAEALGLVDSQLLFAFTNALSEGDPAAAIEAIAAVARAGRDYQQFTRQLVEHLKRMLFARSLGAKFVDEGLAADETARYREAAAQWDESDLLRILLMTSEVGQRLRKGAPQPRLELELFAMRAAKLDPSIDIRTLISRLEGINVSSAAIPTTPPPPAQNRAPVSSKPMVRPPEQRTPAVEVPPTPKASRGHDGDIEWQPILEAICEHRPMLRSVLGHAQLMRTAPGVFELIVPKTNEFQQRQLSEKPTRDLINTEIIKFVGQGARVTTHVRAGAATPPPTGGVAQPRASGKAMSDEQMADHGLQEILRRFDGEIVE